MFKFIKTKDPDNEFDHDDITFEISDDGVTISDLMDSFHRFLKACSYHFNLNDEIVLLKKPNETVGIAEPIKCCESCVNFYLDMFDEPCFSCNEYDSFVPKSKE